MLFSLHLCKGPTIITSTLTETCPSVTYHISVRGKSNNNKVGVTAPNERVKSVDNIAHALRNDVSNKCISNCAFRIINTCAQL